MVVWYARNKWVIGVIRIEGEGEEGGGVMVRPIFSIFWGVFELAENSLAGVGIKHNKGAHHPPVHPTTPGL